MHQLIAQIDWQHGYFSPPNRLRMRATPSSATARLLHNMRLVAKIAEGSIRLYAEDLRTLELFNDDFLVFYLSPLDPYFFAYTQQMPCDTHLSQLYQLKDRAEMDVYAFDQGRSLNLPKRLAVINQALKKPGAEAAISDAEKTELSPAQIEKLHQEKQRLKQIIQDSLEQQKATPPLIISVSCQELLNNLESVKPMRLRFTNSSTFFKYYLCRAQSDAEYQIKDVKKQVVFAYQGEQRLENGEQAQVYLSDTELPLVNPYPYRFQLAKQDQQGTAIVLKELPLPSVRNINHHWLQDKKLAVSETFIYL